MGGQSAEYLLRRRGALEQQRVGTIDSGGRLAPHAADPAAAGVNPIERVRDPRPPLDEHPDVPRRRQIFAPRPAPRRAACDGRRRRVRVRGRGELGADAGAPDGGVPIAERGEEGGEGVRVAGADGFERGGGAGAGAGEDGRGRGGSERGDGGQLEVAEEEENEEQDGGGGEHRGHVVDPLPYEHRGSSARPRTRRSARSRSGRKRTWRTWSHGH
jgi:hypothetical protein